MAFFTSDWHIHSVASYDANLHVAHLVEAAAEQGITDYGLTDHVNIPSWIQYLKASRELHKLFAHPGFHLGVELTTISGHWEEYDRTHGSLAGFVHPGTAVDPVAFPLNADELDACGVEYVIGAAHSRLVEDDSEAAMLKDLQRQNLYCACSPLVDIVGHPYYTCSPFRHKDGTLGPLHDLSIVTQSMREELFAAIRQNGKLMEINLSFFVEDYPETFCREYSEFCRAAFEYGIPVTIGSDTHGSPRPEGHGYHYPNRQAVAEKYLGAVGFTDADFSHPSFGKRSR